jgi:hypothetical protein
MFEKVNWFEVVKLFVNISLFLFIFLHLFYGNMYVVDNFLVQLLGFLGIGINSMAATLMSDNIMFMMTLAKRYFTRKSIKNKYCAKRSYAMDGKSTNEELDKNLKGHKHVIVDFSETKIKDSEFLEKFYDNTFGLLSTNGESFNCDVTKETIQLEQNLDSELVNQQADAMVVNTKEMALIKTSILPSVPALVVIIFNYTTAPNKITQVVQPGAIETGYLKKGISIHDKNALVAIIKSKHDFNRVINLVERGIKPAVEQTNIIKEYSSGGLNVEQITAEQARKFASGIPTAYCKFDARSETKVEFIKRLKQA